MSWLAVGTILAVLGAALVGGLAYVINMPGDSRVTHLQALTPLEGQISNRLRAHVQKLAGDIGGRGVENRGSLDASLRYIEQELHSFGYTPHRQAFSAAGTTFENLEAELAGTEKNKEIVIVGAHYDTAGGLPGANDNGSGVAATLELASLFAELSLKRNVRWLFFVNEEPPYFQGPLMGSYVYANRCRERNENIKAMVSLETIGYYSDEPRSQRYPVSFHPGYPDRGNFLGFVCDLRSAPLLRRVIRSFRQSTDLPSEGAAAPGGIPGVSWSDHWSFSQVGYRALMVTDTAPYRYPHYHTAQDTPDKLDYDRMARAVSGLAGVVRDLASQ